MKKVSKVYMDTCINIVFSCIMGIINSFSWQNNLVCIYQLSFIQNVHVIYAETSVGVFAKRTIQKNVQFGPFVGELVMKDSDINSKFPLAVSFYILQANTLWQFHIQFKHSTIDLIQTPKENCMACESFNWNILFKKQQNFAIINRSYILCIFYMFGFS